MERGVPRRKHASVLASSPASQLSLHRWKETKTRYCSEGRGQIDRQVDSAVELLVAEASKFKRKKTDRTEEKKI